MLNHKLSLFQTAGVTCPDGWVHRNSSIYCYYFALGSITWLGAEANCTAQGSHLASITSVEEHQFIKGRFSYLNIFHLL